MSLLLGTAPVATADSEQLAAAQPVAGMPELARQWSPPAAELRGLDAPEDAEEWADLLPGSKPQLPSALIDAEGAADAAAAGRSPGRGGRTCGSKSTADILFGQLLAMLLCLTGICSRNLAELGIAAPTCQNAANYLALALVYGPGLVCRRHRRRAHPRPQPADGRPTAAERGWRWWHWAAVAVCDVEANYFVVKAYSLTSFSSAQLLDCFALPCVLLLSALFLGHKYGRTHLAGAAATLAGVLLMVTADWQTGGSDGAEADAEADEAGVAAARRRRAIGDLLCLLSAGLYACSNVGQEAGLRRAARVGGAAASRGAGQWLGVVGLVGVVLSAAQIAALEREELDQVTTTLILPCVFH